MRINRTPAYFLTIYFLVITCLRSSIPVRFSESFGYPNFSHKYVTATKLLALCNALTRRMSQILVVIIYPNKVELCDTLSHWVCAP